MESDGAGACGLQNADYYGPAHSPDLPDWCTPLDDPRWVTPSEASLMRDADPVVGFEAAGRVWAIPWWVMKNHHAANLTLEGRPFLVTLCEMCVAGGVFDPMLGGQRGWFQNNGWYNGSPLMTDDLTGSLWALVNGRCVAGPSEGAVLPMRPTVHAPWAEWLKMYPETVVADGAGEPRDGHGARFPSPDHDVAGHLEVRGIDQTELVVSVEVGEIRRAYLLASLHEQGGIVEDTVDGRPIVVLTFPGTWLCVVFASTLEGRPLHLGWDRANDPPTHIIDRTAGWRFDLWGRCLTDEHRGLRLPYVRSSLKKWRRWMIANPEAELLQSDRAQVKIRMGV